MKYLMCVISFLVFLTSCNLGVESYKLSGNSFYKNEGKGDRMISSSNHSLYRTAIYPDVIAYVFNDEFIIAKQRPDKLHWPQLLGLDLYSRYTAHAEYLKDPNIFERDAWRNLEGKIEFDTVNYKMFHERGASLEKSSEDIRIREEVVNFLISNDPYYKKIFSNDINYWIIYNPKDTLIGPLNKDEYLVQRKRLGVPDDLQLE
jgi:hypothetical protein